MSEMFSTRALLALQTVGFIAYHGQNGTPVKSSRIIERYQLNRRALEPILQILSRANIVESKQGANGGYLLVAPKKTTLGDVALLFMDKPAKSQLCFSDWQPVILPILEQAHLNALATLKHITLADIAHQAEAQGISRSEEAPLDFII